MNLQNTKLLTNKNWQKHNNFFTVFNPFLGEPLMKIPDWSLQEADEAMQKAKEAFLQWSKTNIKKRAEILLNWYQLVLENQEDFAKIIVAEEGKPLQEAKTEVTYGASFIGWFAEQAKRIKGEIVCGYDENTTIEYTKEAVGVVGIITPWNFPFAMITRKVAPALAAGCCALVKPSELAPLSALALENIAKEAGLPEGVLQIITSTKPREIGDFFCHSNDIRKISFTGSTKVGKILFEKSAANIKKLSLELGGNAAFIVFEDADLDLAAKSLIACKFRNSGQTCVCANRIFIHKSILEKFLEKFFPLVENLQLGDGLEPQTTQGPLIGQAAIEKVQKHIQNALDDGAKLLLGGKKHSLGGTFFEPTIITGIKPNGIFWQEETFGPVAPIYVFDSEEEVIKLANATNSGLSNYFFTKNFQRIRRVNQKLLSGIIGINTGIISNEFGPFGGIKESGIGKEGSELGIEEYLNIKYTMISYQ